MSSATQKVEAGTLIAGTYRLKRLLGRGGMGAVWEAEHQRLPDKRVAIKVLSTDHRGDSEVLARFRREAEIAARLAHKNIVEIHDYNVLDDGTPYLVLEYLEGESLDERLARGPMPVDELLDVIVDVCAALRTAHAANVVHRDLKPHNVFLCADRDGRGPAKVLDFGISKIRGSDTVKTQTETVLGTPQYMSPEQATGRHDTVDARTDIFCLGIMMFEMLTGKPPFTGQNVPEVVFKIVYESEPKLDELAPAAPTELRAAIHRALAKKPEDRFASVEELLAAIGRAPLSTPVPAASPTPTLNPRQELAIAETIDSGAAARSQLKLSDMATTGAPGETPVAAKERPRRWTLAVAALAVAACCVAAAIALKGPSAATGPEASAAEAESATRPAADPPATTPSDEADAETASADAAAPPATQAPPRPTTRSDRLAAGSKDRNRKPGTDAGAPAVNGDKPQSTTAPLPGPQRLKRMAPAVRDKLQQAIAALRAGDTATAVLLADRAYREGGGDAALAVEATARCRRQELGRLAAVLRKVKHPALRERLRAYCASLDIYAD